MGSDSSFLSFGVFLPPPHLQAFPLLVAGQVLPLLPPRWTCLLQFCVGFPLFPSSVLRVLHPLCTCLFCCCLFSLFFSFFPGWGLVCPGDYADVAQGCLWEYHIPLSSLGGLHLPKWSGSWHLVA
jgi:hypothetical protein